MAGGGGRTLTWTADNLPATITGTDGVTESYVYDAEGQRLKRTRSGVTTVYLGGWSRRTSAPAPGRRCIGETNTADRHRRLPSWTYYSGIVEAANSKAAASTERWRITDAA